ncbi:response regulator transcription factor [Egicoccus sp. AB-alg6-2]|uniref:response regulator transcription factor n=1 Tax=Egicoccus sp. AB-alg6-2 TaxID=3242692 RepID=UPI00359CD2E0
MSVDRDSAPRFVLLEERRLAAPLIDRVRARLALDGFALRTVTLFDEAVDLLDSGTTTGVVVSIAGGAGFETIRDLRRRTAEPLIVVLPEGASEEARVLAWELGADDVLVEPFSAPEFSARLRAVLRRTSVVSAGTLLYAGPLQVDVAAREAHLNGNLLTLTAQEFSLLAFLVARQRQVFTRRELLQHAWIGGRHGQDRATVTEHVRRLRRKFDAAGAVGDRWIVTVHGIGYRFDPQPHDHTVLR